MIKKIVMASAIAILPMAAVGTVGLSGVASAKTPPPPPAAVTCSATGSLTFAKAGLTSTGTLEKKATSKAAALVTPDCSGAAVPTTVATIKPKITSNNQACDSSDTSTSDACAIQAQAEANYNATCATPKKPICKPYKTDGWEYGDAASFISSNGSGASPLNAELAVGLQKGIKVTDNGNKLVLNFSTATLAATALGNTSCGTGATDGGFVLSGTGGVAVPGSTTTVNFTDYDSDGNPYTVPVTQPTTDNSVTWSASLCLTGDSGTNTTGSFITDLLTAAGGGNVTILSGTFGGPDTEVSITPVS